MIRLEHALTKRNLHSEEIYQSMITNGQEVSAFGNGGKGDDSKDTIIQMTTGSSNVLESNLGSSSTEVTFSS